MCNPPFKNKTTLFKKKKQKTEKKEQPVRPRGGRACCYRFAGSRRTAACRKRRENAGPRICRAVFGSGSRCLFRPASTKTPSERGCDTSREASGPRDAACTARRVRGPGAAPPCFWATRRTRYQNRAAAPPSKTWPPFHAAIAPDRGRPGTPPRRWCRRSKN